jgi:3-dehydroquinate dehydratase-2
MKMLVLNGPNLKRLDLRDKNVYGEFDYPSLERFVLEAGKSEGFEIDMRVSDDEATLIGWLHEAADKKTPVIINPAAFTHYSYSIRDAVMMLKAPVIEVHLSNPLSREEFRHTSVVSGVVSGTIAGFGANSYRLALIAMRELITNLTK